MAKEEDTVVKLTPEQIAALKKQQEDINKSRKEVAALKRMGMITTDLEDKLNWAENNIKIMLETWGG